MQELTAGQDREDGPERQEQHLASQQTDCVNFVGPQLLVSGPPGTGKTIVLLRRAKKLAEERTSPGGKVLFITFNKTLAQYAKEQLRLNLNAKDDIGTIVIHNYHSWAYHVLAQAGTQLQVVYGLARQTLVGKALAAYRTMPHAQSATSGSPASSLPTRLLSRGLDWWEDEIDWVKGRAIEDWETYRTIERTGRGQGLRENGRRIVWDVLTQYNHLLHQDGHCDFRDYTLRLLALGTPLPDRWRVDHVLIDEAQDLHFADLSVLTQLARQTTTIVADRKQKIYQTGFTWRDLGFDVTGGSRARVLSQMYRTTRQIAMLAATLQRHDPLIRPGDLDYGPGALPSRDGPLPVVYQVRDQAHEEASVTHLLTHLMSSSPSSMVGNTIGLLAYSWRELKHLEALLQRHHLPYERLQDREGSITTPGIKLTTFHSAKGLEFDDVVLTGLREGGFFRTVTTSVSERNGAVGRDKDDGDETDATDETEAIHTARRVLYVAMTRAKRRLYVLHGIPPSRYIAELGTAYYRSTSPEVETS